MVPQNFPARALSLIRSVCSCIQTILMPDTDSLEIRQYLYDDAIKADVAAYRQLYEDVKIEAAMITIVSHCCLRFNYSSSRPVSQNSPYAEVRAVVDNFDDPMLPSMTFRAGLIGLIYVVIGAFINQFFSIRQPGISIEANVAQLLFVYFS